MKLSKQIARKFIFPVITGTGLEKIWRNNTENSILNILYHGVVSKDSNYFSPRHITSEMFERHLNYIVEEFDIISIPEAFEINNNKIKLKRKAVTVSFDDGYKNNLDIALPLLEKYNIKTTFFISSITTQDMDLRTLWADIISCLEYFNKNEIIEIGNFRFANFKDELSGISLYEFIKSRNANERDDILDLLTKKYDLKSKLKKLPNEIWELMNKDELQKLSSSSIVDIGSHGHLHYNLGDINITDARNDMLTSKTLLENTIDKKVDMIAYPDGSYTNNVKDVAGEIGFDKQLAVDFKYTDDNNDNRILKRHGMSTTTTYESGIFFLNKAFQSRGF